MDESLSLDPRFTWKDHKFCYVYWENGRNGSASVYYLNTPQPFDYSPDHKFSTPPNEDLRSFVAQLKRHGWQEYMSQANPEAYESWLMRIPPLDAHYEYCLLTCYFSIKDNATTPPQRKDLYRIGDRNEHFRIEGGESYRWTYPQMLDYLEREGWEFTHHDEYSTSKQYPNHRLQLRFYRRPAPSA